MLEVCWSNCRRDQEAGLDVEKRGREIYIYIERERDRENRRTGELAG